LSKRRLCLRFFLDEDVPVSTGKALERAGHDVIYFDSSGVGKSSADPVVCLAADINKAILVAHDGDMKTLAKGHGVTPARFKALNILKLSCRESVGPRRVAEAMSLIVHEWRKGNGRERRLFVVLGDQVIRTHR
jgi:predicted nuclease of predicted toxin-antitoxin system